MRKLVRIAIFAAVAVTLGFVFVFIPNLEMVTATFFLSGYLLGVRDGVITAALGELIYSLLNPMGSAAPPLLAAQILGMVCTAIAGGIFVRLHSSHFFNSGFTPAPQPNLPAISDKSFFTILGRLQFFLSFSLVGLVVTAVYDLLTTAGFLLVSGFSLGRLFASLVFGLPFYLLHIGTNILIFTLLVPPVIIIMQNRISVNPIH